MGIPGLPSINIAKQLLGTAAGQKVEDAEDSLGAPIASELVALGEDFAKSEAASFLSSKGIPTTLVGAAQYMDQQLQSAIEVDAPPAVAADLVKLVASLFSAVQAKLPSVTI